MKKLKYGTLFLALMGIGFASCKKDDFSNNVVKSEVTSKNVNPSNGPTIISPFIIEPCGNVFRITMNPGYAGWVLPPPYYYSITNTSTGQVSGGTINGNLSNAIQNFSPCTNYTIQLTATSAGSFVTYPLQVATSDGCGGDYSCDEAPPYDPKERNIYICLETY